MCVGRVCSFLLHDWSFAVSVRTAFSGRGICHGSLLSTVEFSRSGALDVDASRTRPPYGEGRIGSLAFARKTWPRFGAANRTTVVRGFGLHRGCRFGPWSLGSVPWAGDFSARFVGPAFAAVPCADWKPRGSNRAAFARCAERHSGRSWSWQRGDHAGLRRGSAAELSHQHYLSLDKRAARSGASGGAASEFGNPRERVRGAPPARPARQISGLPIFVRSRRHRDPDHEFRRSNSR